MEWALLCRANKLRLMCRLSSKEAADDGALWDTAGESRTTNRLQLYVGVLPAGPGAVGFATCNVWD